MEWGYLDYSVRLRTYETAKQLGVYENLHLGHVSSAAFADERTFITGGRIHLCAYGGLASPRKLLDWNYFILCAGTTEKSPLWRRLATTALLLVVPTITLAFYGI